MCWNVTHEPKIPDSSHHPNTPLLDPGKLSWTDSDIKTQTCNRGIEWVTAEKQINSLKLQDSLQVSNQFVFFPSSQIYDWLTPLWHHNTFFSGINYLCFVSYFLSSHDSQTLRVNLLNFYRKPMFGPIYQRKSVPSVQERLMGMLKDSCFHQFGELEMNADPHEELIPSPVTLSHLSYTTPLFLLVYEFSSLALSFIPCVRDNVGTECFGCFVSFSTTFIVFFLNSCQGLTDRGFYLSFCIEADLLRKVITGNYFNY